MTISTTASRISYNGNGATTAFSFPYRFLTNADLVVIKVAADGTETTLTLNTNYTVTGADEDAGGTVTLSVAPLSGQRVVIYRSVSITQEVDYITGDPFPAETHERALDRLTMVAQQQQDAIDRSAKLPVTSTEDADALIADIIRLADSADNIDTLAGIEADITTVAGIDTEVTTVAGIAANVTTVAGIAANVTSVAGNATNINAVAGNSTNINTVAGISSDVTTVAGISGDVAAVENIASNVTTVAGISSNVTTVAGISSAVSTVASNNTNVSTVATNIANVNTAATNIAAIIAAPTEATNAANSASAAATSAAAAAASAASGMYSAVQDKSANYTVVAGDAGDLIRVTTTSGAITITLPAISSVSDGFKVAIVKWTSDANAVNINRSGSDTINGATTAQIGSQYSQIILVADAETSTWFASQSGLGATNVNVDNFSGNGSTTAFTLSSDPSTENNTSVFISGIYQQKNTYSVSGTTLTFSTAPPSGSSNIEVYYATPLAIGTPSDGTVTAEKLAGGTVNTTADIGANGLTVGKGAGAVSTNTAVGANALAANTTGAHNTALGYGALKTNTTSNYSTAIGRDALTLATGARNTAIGAYSQNTVSTGTSNTSIGVGALNLTTTGSYNTAVGDAALLSNTTASHNIALGYQAGYSNTTGAQNIFQGSYSGYNNTTGSFNTSLGYNAYAVSGAAATGNNNTAVGHSALNQNTTGGNGVAVGYYALSSSTTGTENIAIGATSLNALTTGNNNIAIGYNAGVYTTALTNGGSNILIGNYSKTSSSGASNQIVMGYDATGKGDNTFFHNRSSSYNGGNTSTWNTTSDRRLKKNIVDNNEGLSKLIGLQIRNFEYRLKDEITELDSMWAIEKEGVQLGVIAQELQEVLPECVKEQSTGVLSVDSDNLQWYLINAIKELKAELDAAKADIATLKGA